MGGGSSVAVNVVLALLLGDECPPSFKTREVDAFNIYPVEDYLTFLLVLSLIIPT